MQLSPANFLIATQQGAKPAPRPDAGGTALAAQQKPFEPALFKDAAKPAQAQAAPARLGSHIDIKV